MAWITNFLYACLAAKFGGKFVTLGFSYFSQKISRAAIFLSTSSDSEKKEGVIRQKFIESFMPRWQMSKKCPLNFRWFYQEGLKLFQGFFQDCHNIFPEAKQKCLTSCQTFSPSFYYLFFFVIHSYLQPPQNHQFEELGAHAWVKKQDCLEVRTTNLLSEKSLPLGRLSLSVWLINVNLSDHVLKYYVSF